MKKCTKCGIEKPLEDYYYRKDRNVYEARCKVCCGIANKKNKEKNEAKYKKYKAEYYLKNKRKRKPLTNEQKERQKKYKAKYYQENKKEIRTKQVIYEKENEKSIKEYKLQWQHEKLKTDELFYLKRLYRNRTKSFIKSKNVKIDKKSEELLGCLFEEFEMWLSFKFKIRYNYDFDWKSYRENNQQYGWHIEHIIPLDSAKTTEELEKLFHYSNQEFRWWKENLEKGVKNNI